MTQSATIDVGSWLDDDNAVAPTASDPCGLFSTDKKKSPVPLRSRSIDATVYAEHGFCEVQETLTYLADEDVTARFIFPLPPRAAVYRFTATIGDRKVVTEVKRKAEAQAEYDSAVRQGHTAVQMQQGKGASLYRVDIGNLSSMDECVVTFSYVRLLNSVAGSVEFEHQATWVPPYFKAEGGARPPLSPPTNPPPGAIISDGGGLPAAVDPPTPLPGLLPLPTDGENPSYAAGKVSYKLSYRIQVRSSRGFRSIECPSSASPVEVTEEGEGLRLVKLGESVSDASRDFTLLVELPPLPESHPGQIMIQECQREGGKKKTVALATFVPPSLHLVKDTPSSSAPPSTTTTAPSAEGAVPSPSAATTAPPFSSLSPPPPPPCEIYFVIDGSGSMDGAPIAQALEASLYFVKDLPANKGIAFNAIVFGSSHSKMWESCRPYNEESQKEAVAWLQTNVHANYGGTEVFTVLDAIYKTPLPKEDKAATRQIIFLTDGGVDGGEEANIMSLIEGGGKGKGGEKDKEDDVAKRTTVFSLGIGHGVHRGLVEGVAKRSGGVAQFVVDGEPLAKKIGMLKKCALAVGGADGGGGCLANPKMVSRACLVRAAPNVLPPRLFPGEPFPVLVEIQKSEKGASLDLKARPLAPSTSSTSLTPPETTTTLSLSLDSAVRVPDGDAFAVLHAMACIGALLNGTSELHCSQDGTMLPNQPDAKQVDEAIVALAISEGLVTPLTSAVGVLLQQDPLDPSKVKKVEVPLEVPTGRKLWEQQQQPDQVLRGAPRMMMAMMNGPPPAMMMRCRGGPPPPPSPYMTMSSAAAPGGMAAPASPPMASKRKMKMHMKASPPSPQQQHQHMDLEREADDDEARPPRRGIFSAIGGAIGGLASGAAARLGGRGGGGGGKGMSHDAGASAPMAMDDEDEEGGEQDVGVMAEAEESGAAGSYDMMTMEKAEMAPLSPPPPPPPPAAAAPAATKAMAADQVLALLNMKRTVDGAIPSTKEVLEALFGKAWERQLEQQQQAAGGGGGASPLSDFASAQLAAARPAGLAPGSEEAETAWVTILALAYLRKHLASEKHVWGGLEAKALAWLAQAWPAAGMTGSVGGAVLGAMKVV